MNSLNDENVCISPVSSFSVNYINWEFVIVTALIITNLLHNCLRARRPRGRSLIPGRGKFFLLLTSSRSVLRPSQPPVQ
jgi:hypothetical protein